MTAEKHRLVPTAANPVDHLGRAVPSARLEERNHIIVTGSRRWSAVVAPDPEKIFLWRRPPALKYFMLIHLKLL